jgi:hypothetical protein
MDSDFMQIEGFLIPTVIQRKQNWNRPDFTLRENALSFLLRFPEEETKECFDISFSKFSLNLSVTKNISVILASAIISMFVISY